MSRQQRQLEPAAPLPEQSQSDREIVLRPFQVGEPLPRRMSVSDMCRAFSIDGRPMDRSTFHKHQRAGKFDRFELRPKIGARAWSGTLVQRHLDCEDGASRFSMVGGKKAS